MKVISLVLLCFVAENSAFLFGSGPAWDGLRVTFGIVSAFNRMPREEQSAINAGWKKDKSCSVTNGFVGNRYILKGDTAVMLLFDHKGYIAGIQAGIPKGKPYPSSNIKSWFIEEEKMYTITAYFVNPETICSQGRSSAQFNEQGTGTGLWVQQGPNPIKNPGTDLYKIPAQQSDLAGTKWTEGKCFYTMGKHYWYDISKDMKCDEFRPIFLLYNGGKLNAFGWAFNAALTSERYEHPPKSSIQAFMQTPPTCILNTKDGLSTMHIYLSDSPRSNFC